MTDTELKESVRRIMYRHVGRGFPIDRADLLDALGLPHTSSADRRLREIIRQLKRDLFPIQFATEKPAGYYLPANERELIEGIEKLKGYVKDECITIRALRTGGSRFLAGDKQLELI